MIAAQSGWYSFVVPAHVRKEDIAKEISDLYAVRVTDVRTIKRTGKARRTGRKMIVKRRPDWKRAMVKLAKGQKIAVFDIGDQSNA